jgi:uncharacterized coiled-coil protein SlyX
LEKQLELKNEELKEAEEERRMLGELATVNSMTVRKLEMERDYSRNVLPEDSLDKICRLENMLKLEKHKAEGAQKEQKLQAVTLAKQDKEIQRLTNELEFIKKETGWTSSYSSKPAFRTVAQSEAANRIGELQLMVSRLEEEQKTNKQIQRKKTLLIESLSKELDGKKKTEEDYYQALNTIKLKDREIRDLMEEMKTLKRIQAKKDKVITGLEGSKDDSSAIRILEGDKRYLQSEIAKHMDVRRQLEKTIKSQQFRIDQLETRLDAVSSALKDLNLDKQLGEILRAPPPSRIRVEEEATKDPVYDLQLRHVSSLRNALTVKEALLHEKDANVEALERKVESMSNTKGGQPYADRRYRAEIDDLKKALDTQTGALKSQIDKLRSENAKLKATPSRTGYSA